MRPCRSPGRKAWWALTFVALLGTATPRQAAIAQQDQPGRTLLLEVVVNGRRIGEVGEFHERAGNLFVARQELAALGFKLARAAPGETGDTELALASLPGLAYRLAERTQTLYVTAPNAALAPTELQPDVTGRPGDLTVESSVGAVANYNVVATRIEGHTLVDGLFDGRVFSKWGLFASSFTATAGVASASPAVVRLDSAYTFSDPATLRRYRAGDLTSGGVAWSRPVRMAGLQATTDFSMRPDLVTFPVPTISGQVAVPSSVDVLVNGVQMLSRSIPAGPFEIRQLPVVTGSGDVSLVVRNAVGQDIVQTLPVYTSALLLAQGLAAYSAEIGTVRLNYDGPDDQYRGLAASVSYRYGVLEWLTLEGHAEGTSGDAGQGSGPARAGGMAGGGAAFTLGRLGAVSVGLAGSRFGGRSGALLSAAFERIGPRLSLTGSVQATTAGFGDVASAYGDPVPRLQIRGSIGWSMGRFGSLGLAYVGLRRDAASRQAAPLSLAASLRTGYAVGYVPLPPATRVSLVSASYSRPVLAGRAYLYATGYHDFANSQDTGAMMGLTWALGSRSAASVSGSFDGTRPAGTLQASQSATTVGDVGWQAQASVGEPMRQVATGEYKSPWGLVSLGADRSARQTSVRAGAQGAVAIADGGVFAANSIYDSFAVVDTGSPGIEVLQENRPVGRTGASGLLLVPDLRSFDANRLGIDPTAIPLDAQIGKTSRMVRPQDHSGVVVHFPVRSSQGAIVSLVGPGGALIEPGSIARLNAAKADELPVGYDGEAFVTGLGPRNVLLVTTPAGRTCRAEFAYQPAVGRLPRIGPVACVDIPP